MGILVYTALTSLDGYIADDAGNFDWAEPQEDVHSYANELEAKNGTILLGRAMYEVLSAWEDLPDIERQPKYIGEYQAAWKKARKIVFSSTLDDVTTSNTVLKRTFDKGEIERMKNDGPGTLGIGGANLASQALDLGLIDEIYRFIFPVMIGSGKKWLGCGKPTYLRKIETRDFRNGVVMIRYGTGNARGQDGR